MADLTQIREIFAPVEGTVIAPADFANITADIDSVAGQLIRAIGGPNFLPNIGPLTLVPSGGMNIVAGGPGQGLIAQGRFLDVCAATTIALPLAGTTDRVDLIAVKAVRVPGAQSQNRTVIPDNAPSNTVALKLPLINGTASYTFSPVFNAPPVVALAPEAADANASLSLAITATKVTVTSSDAADTRTIDLEVIGNAPGSAGSTQSEPLYENQPSYAVVRGSSTLTPQTPAGYEALASVYVHAYEGTIAAGDITVLFNQLASPILDAIFRNLTVATLLCEGAVTAAGLISSFGGTTSTYGATNANVNGPVLAKQVSVGAAPTPFAYQYLDSRADFVGLGVAPFTATKGVYGSVFAINEASVGQFLGLDYNGNLGITGQLYALGIQSDGNVYAKNGTFAAPAGVGLAFAPGNLVKATMAPNGDFVTVGGLSSYGLTVNGSTIIAPVGAATAQGNAPSSVLYLQSTAFVNGASQVVNNQLQVSTANSSSTLKAQGYNGPLALDLSGGALYSGDVHAAYGSFSGNLTGADGRFSRGDGTGYTFFGGGAQFFGWNGTTFVLSPGQLTVLGNIQAVAITLTDNLYMGTHDVKNVGALDAASITSQNYQGKVVQSVGGFSGAVNVGSRDNSIVITPTTAQDGTETLDLTVQGSGIVGSVAFARLRLTSTVNSQTVTVPYTLAPGTWVLYAEAEVDIPGGSMSLTGGGGGNWEGTQTVPDAQGPTVEYIDIGGTSNGGNKPSVTISFNGAGGGSPSYFGTLKLWATRTA